MKKFVGFVFAMALVAMVVMNFNLVIEIRDLKASTFNGVSTVEEKAAAPEIIPGAEAAVFITPTPKVEMATPAPTVEPTTEPTATPTAEPTATPTVEPTVAPVEELVMAPADWHAITAAWHQGRGGKFNALNELPAALEDKAVKVVFDYNGFVAEVYPTSGQGAYNAKYGYAVDFTVWLDDKHIIMQQMMPHDNDVQIVPVVCNHGDALRNSTYIGKWVSEMLWDREIFQSIEPAAYAVKNSDGSWTGYVKTCGGRTAHNLVVKNDTHAPTQTTPATVNEVKYVAEAVHDTEVHVAPTPEVTTVTDQVVVADLDRDGRPTDVVKETGHNGTEVTTVTDQVVVADLERDGRPTNVVKETGHNEAVTYSAATTTSTAHNPVVENVHVMARPTSTSSESVATTSTTATTGHNVQSEEVHVMARP